MTSEQTLRLECLQIASRYGHIDTTAEHVVARARALYEFVNGNNNEISPKLVTMAVESQDVT